MKKIDYDKKYKCRISGITKVNKLSERKYWTKYFQNLIKEKI